MSLILTPPPTVMVFFKEISLKNESTDYVTLIYSSNEREPPLVNIRHGSFISQPPRGCGKNLHEI